MSKIKSKNTALETDFRKMIWNSGIKYRLHYNIVGKPDLAIVKNKIAIFIDSCFWHRCPKHCRKPGTNTDYWNNKLKNNAERDKRVNGFLKKKGWKVLRFWEHDIKKNPERCVEKIKKGLNH